MAESTVVDFAAVGRVSKFAELEAIRLTAMTATCDPSVSGPLEAQLTNDCIISNRDLELLSVETTYHFVGRSGDLSSVEIDATYLLLYRLKATEMLSEADVSQFSSANGRLHSWPFVRELLNGMTSRMGFPPFTLGVMHFIPQPTSPQVNPQAIEPVVNETV